MLDIHHSLMEAGLLPAELPDNYSFRKVRALLSEMEKMDAAQMKRAIEAAQSLEVRGPLAVAIFLKHHLLGAHEAEVDRLVENEEQGTRYAVLVYPEGELPVRLDYLKGAVQAGSRVRYEPASAEYTVK
ncbi:MAG: hypothetical protein ICV60_04775 [Pyrinomonadaceae bacterium]|nr:hypothetical protein [Pyrinomonadaceae bacterium]